MPFFLVIYAILVDWVATVLTTGTAATLFQNDVLGPILGAINGFVGSIRANVPI